MVRIRFLKLLVVVTCALQLSCENILSEFGDKTTNEAKFFDAIMLINDAKWTEAIDLFEDMDSSYLEKPEVAYQYASAYAGRCGLDFIGMVETLKDLSDRLFVFMMKAMTGATQSEADDCKRAEEIVIGIEATANDRTDDQNMLMIFIAFAKIGANLTIYADEDENQTTDATFNSCVTTAAGAPDANIAEVATGFAHAKASLQALSSEVVEGLDPADLEAMCTSIDTIVGASYNFCNDTDTADITGNKMKGIRSVLKEDASIGLGGVCTGDLTACNCP